MVVDGEDLRPPPVLPYSKLGEPPEDATKGWRRWLWDPLHTIALILVTLCMAVLMLALSPILFLVSVVQNIYVSQKLYHRDPSTLRVAVVGGGWSGLQCMARLHELGVKDVEGFERNDDWGGTWHSALRYYSVQIHGSMWITSFSKFPYSKDPDIQDGKVLGEEALEYVQRFGTAKGLSKSYAMDSKVTEIQYTTKDRSAMLVVEDGKGQQRTEGPYDLVIYASIASEPNIPDLSNRDLFKGEVLHTNHFKKERYDNIVKEGKKVVIVGGSKAGCDMALCFYRGGYNKKNFTWLYRQPYLFWKYEAVLHDRTLWNTLRGFTVLVGMLATLVSSRLGGWIFWASGYAVSYDETKADYSDLRKFSFGILCPKQRRDLANIDSSQRIQGNPTTYTWTGLKLQDGRQVDADVVLFATGCQSGISKIRLVKDGAPYSLDPITRMFDHFIFPEFPVLANSTALWTTMGPARACNSAEMAVYHLCVRKKTTEEEMKRLAKEQLGGSTNSDKGIVFAGNANPIVTFVKLHLDLLFRGYVNVFDFLRHVIEIFCLGKHAALKMTMLPSKI